MAFEKTGKIMEKKSFVKLSNMAILTAIDSKKGHGPICQAWKDVEGLGDWLFEQRNTKHNPDEHANKPPPR